jgi:uncharacterized YccA/Bax inhibitor family protein
VRSSSNPAFRNLPSGQGGGYATFDRQGGAMGGATAYADTQAAQVGYGKAGSGERPLTMDDVVTKTAITGSVALVAGVLTAFSGLYALVIPAFIVGLVVSLIVIFKQSSNPGLVLTYSAAMGVALGGITGALEMSGTQFEGIGFQAVVGTTGGLGLRDGSPLAYLFSIICIGVAAFSLLLDFDMADRAVRDGAPAKFGWYIAFGLMTTLVWLYIEILRLLTYLRSE